MNINTLIVPGRPVIDIGANIGDKTFEFLALGASPVVAVDIQYDLATHLLRRFVGQPVIVVCAAVTEKPGDFVQILAAPSINTITTVQEKWTKGRFAVHQWGKGVKIPTIDLAGLVSIAGGDPSYIKIDAEGSEITIARGMKAKGITPALISFEYAIEYFEDVVEITSCFDEKLYTFSYTFGENVDTVIPFCERQEFLKAFRDNCPGSCWGAVFARRNN